MKQRRNRVFNRSFAARHRRRKLTGSARRRRCAAVQVRRLEAECGGCTRCRGSGARNRGDAWTLRDAYVNAVRCSSQILFHRNVTLSDVIVLQHRTVCRAATKNKVPTKRLTPQGDKEDAMVRANVERTLRHCRKIGVAWQKMPDIGDVGVWRRAGGRRHLALCCRRHVEPRSKAPRMAAPSPISGIFCQQTAFPLQ